MVYSTFSADLRQVPWNANLLIGVFLWCHGPLPCAFSTQRNSHSLRVAIA